MSLATSPFRIDPLRQSLEALGHKRRWFVFFASLVRSVWWWLLALLSVIIIDGAAPMAAHVRLGVLIGFVVACPVLLWWHRPGSDDPRTGPLRDARLLETFHRLLHNPLVNALCLHRVAAATDSDEFVRTLADRSRQRGRQTIKSIQTQVVIDRRALKRQGGMVLAVALTWIIVAVVLPGLVGGGLLRLVMPLGDHPPFSLTRFGVTVEPTPVIQGDDVYIEASLTGKLPYSCKLVELDDEFNTLRSWPMRAVERGRYVFWLRQVKEPLIFHVAARGGRSHRFTIDPQPRRADEEKDEQRKSKARTKSAAAKQKDKLDRSMFDGSLSFEQPEIFFKLHKLLVQMQYISQQAAELSSVDPQLLDPAAQRQWAKDLKALEAQMQPFSQDARQLAGQCRKAARTARPRMRRLLNELADALEKLGLCGLGNCPKPGFGMGSGSGFGVGSGGKLMGPAGSWANGAKLAGLADQQLLSELLGQFNVNIAGVPGGRRVYTLNIPDDYDPISSGSYTEHDSTGRAIINQPDAMMQQVPPAYRDLVARYFDRLAQEPIQTRNEELEK